LPLKKAVTLEIVLLVTIATFFLPGGDDLYRFYLPFAEGCLDCGFAPYHTSLLLWPLTLIPPRLLWPAWSLLTMLAIVWASHRFNSNGLVALLTFSAFGQIWLGQIDGLLVVGLALALTATNSYLRGVGLLLASVKPHVAGPAISVILWHEARQARAIPWKILAAPGLGLLVSLGLWGWDWPWRWLLARNEPPLHVWRLASLFPYGLMAFGAIFLLHGKRKQVQAALLASALGMPFYGAYSYVVFLIFLIPWWSVPVSYTWLLGYPWLGNRALQLAWLLPLSLLIYLVWPALMGLGRQSK